MSFKNPKKFIKRNLIDLKQLIATVTPHSHLNMEVEFRVGNSRVVLYSTVIQGRIIASQKSVSRHCVWLGEIRMTCISHLQLKLDVGALRTKSKLDFYSNTMFLQALCCAKHDLTKGMQALGLKNSV